MCNIFSTYVVKTIIRLLIYGPQNWSKPIPDAARSKALVCDRSPAKTGWGFKSHRGHGWMSVVGVVSCGNFSAKSWSLFQRSLTDCVKSLCVIQIPREWGGPGPKGPQRRRIKRIWSKGRASFLFWSQPGCDDVTLWCWVIIFRRFERTSCFHPQAQAVREQQVRNEKLQMFWALRNSYTNANNF
jgi:hypothetical protein